MTKRVLAFLISAFVCGYAMFKGMQILAIVALVSLFVTIYTCKAMQLYESGLEILQSTQQAKIGSLEVQVGKKIEDLSNRLIRQAAWVQMVLTQLSSDQIGILLSISKVEKYPAKEALKNQLRALRARGLIYHDKPTMADSNEVWLSELGKELTDTIMNAETIKRERIPSGSTIEKQTS